MGLRDVVAALLGVSAYAPPKPSFGFDIDDPLVVAGRERAGGNLGTLPSTQLRWYLSDLERAQRAADVGDLSLAAQLCRAMKRDGVLAGLLSTRTSGLVRLPKRFYGNADMRGELEANNGSRSVFDEMFPPSELALLAQDGIQLGIGVAELVPVQGRDYPVMIRLEPQFLRYRWNDGQWFFNSVAGPLPITPGDGRWVLHVPGGRQTPWQSGLWPALGEAWINKHHAKLHRSNFSGKLANPARVAVAPLGATEPQRQDFFGKVMAWGVNQVFGLLPGWDVKLIESNGRGWEVFTREGEDSEREYMICIAGQIVTVTGGSGFANADIHRSIRADLIKDTADGLAYTLNTQGIPPWVVARYGIEALERRAVVEWDVTPPKDRQAEAGSLQTLGSAITTLDAALTPHSRTLDVDRLTSSYGVPILGDRDGDGTPDEVQGDLRVVPEPTEEEAA